MDEKSLFELKEEIRRRELKEAEEKRQKEIQLRETFEKRTGIHVYTSDDYCGLEIGKKFQFYFGYEETFCPKHGKNSYCEDDHDCDKNEWAFVVFEKGKEVMRIPASKIHPENEEVPFWYLVAGIGHYLKKKKK